MNVACRALEQYFQLKEVTCLFCDEIVSKKLAKQHSCPPKQAAEIRLGSKLATYDPVSIVVELERQIEASNQRMQ